MYYYKFINPPCIALEYKASIYIIKYIIGEREQVFYAWLLQS